MAEQDKQKHQVITAVVPDLGKFSEVEIIDVYINIGDIIAVDDPLISLESEKAVLDIPATIAGKVVEVVVSPGDRVSTADIIARVEADSAKADSAKSDASPESSAGTAPPEPSAVPAPEEAPSREVALPELPPVAEPADKERGQAPPVNRQQPGSVYHATPSVRSLARELGVELGRVTGTGPKGRITRADITGFVRTGIQAIETAAAGGALQDLLPHAWTLDDFKEFGPVEEVPISRIKRISGPHLHASWLQIPLVTHFDEADITELESFRTTLRPVPSSADPSVPIKYTLLAFIVKAVTEALKRHEAVNASLDPSGRALILKRHYHIGIAVDTPQGLVVPVIRDTDRMQITQIAAELGRLSTKARDGKLSIDELRGATFSISSLGGIGGTNFTPLVNHPQAAILGVSRMKVSPVWDGTVFQPRTMLPLALSYDHRVIDGAEGARFMRTIVSLLEDIRLMSI